MPVPVLPRSRIPSAFLLAARSPPGSYAPSAPPHHAHQIQIVGLIPSPSRTLLLPVRLATGALLTFADTWPPLVGALGLCAIILIHLASLLGYVRT